MIIDVKGAFHSETSTTIYQFTYHKMLVDRYPEGPAHWNNFTGV
jgi:hypothetical protein